MLTSPLTARPSKKKRSSNFILQFPINGEIVQKWKTIQILFVIPQHATLHVVRLQQLQQ